LWRFLGVSGCAFLGDSSSCLGNAATVFSKKWFRHAVESLNGGESVDGIVADQPVIRFDFKKLRHNRLALLRTMGATG
jgi:hypothetical protein